MVFKMLTKENAGKKLLEHRMEKQITQGKIAEKSGISVQTISAIESGKLKPQSMTIFKLQKYFDSLG